MFKFLFLVFLFIVLFVFLFGFSILRMIFKALFGVRPTPRNTSSEQQKAKRTKKQRNTTHTPKKIITPDEGEYIDFEEIKE
jgi:ribosomal protein L23